MTAKPAKLDGLQRVGIKSRSQWRQWLETHHSQTAINWFVT